MASLELSCSSLCELPSEKLEAGVSRLDASENCLIGLPAELSQCTSLLHLLLYSNQIKALPAEIGKLSKLRTLNLFNNKLMKLPVEIGALSSLEEVNIAANKLMMIPDEAFARWSSVTHLSLNDNNLVRLGSLAPLVALTELRLFSNNLEVMPTLCENSAVQVLEVHKNRITQIDEGFFCRTPKLQRLILSNNSLTSLPASICACLCLRQLQVAENKLASLPDLTWPTSLETIFLEGNEGLAVLPESFSYLPELKRVNVGSAGPAVLAEMLQALVLSKPGGIFWDSSGKAVKSFVVKPVEPGQHGALSRRPSASAPPGSMTVKEWRMRQEEAMSLFILFDQDNDAALNRDELRHLFFQCFPTACDTCEAILDKHFANADVNQNGLLTFDEFVRFYNFLHDVMPEVMATGDWAEALKIFRHFDPSNTGQLGTSEMTLLLHQIFPDRCDQNGDFIKSQMEQADLNKNGTISLAEFYVYYHDIVDMVVEKHLEEGVPSP